VSKLCYFKGTLSDRHICQPYLSFYVLKKKKLNFNNIQNIVISTCNKNNLHVVCIFSILKSSKSGMYLDFINCIVEQCRFICSSCFKHMQRFSSN
jgi:hypothetical protein